MNKDSGCWLGERFDRKDLAFWGVTYGLALLAFLFLYLAAFRLTPPGCRFSGFVHSSHDMYSYQAWSRAYADDGFLVDNPYSNEPRPGAYFNLYWCAVGKIMRLTGLPFLPVLYFSAVISGGVMYLAFLAFMRQFLPLRALAWMAYLLAGFGSGLGWIAFVPYPGKKVLSLFCHDITNAETIPFDAFLAYPHVALSFGLMVLVVLWFHLGTAEGRWSRTVAAGVTVLCLGFFHPFHLVTILGVMTAFYLSLTVRHGRAFLPRWRHLGFLAVAAAPPLVYYRLLMEWSPNFRPWLTQIVNPRGGSTEVLLGFGPHLLLAACGVPVIIRSRRCSDKLLLLLIWTTVSLVLASSYPLFKYSTRVLQGFVVPASVMAAVGFAAISSRWVWGRSFTPPKGQDTLEWASSMEEERAFRPTGRFFLTVLPLMLLAMLSHAVIFGNQLRVIAGKPAFYLGPNNGKIILEEGEAQALDYLSRVVNDGSVIISLQGAGVALPAFAHVRAFSGHYQGTPSPVWKYNMALSFFGDPRTGESRWRKMDELGIDYVWYGPEEAEAGPFVPFEAPYLQQVYGNGTAYLFKVLHGPGYREGAKAAGAP